MADNLKLRRCRLNGVPFFAWTLLLFMGGDVLPPLLLLAKKRSHFLTIGYVDEEGKQQAAVFQVHKNAVRSVLVSLEAKTGMRVEFQDDDARKAGKG